MTQPFGRVNQECGKPLAEWVEAVFLKIPLMLRLWAVKNDSDKLAALERKLGKIIKSAKVGPFFLCP